MTSRSVWVVTFLLALMTGTAGANVTEAVFDSVSATIDDLREQGAYETALEVGRDLREQVRSDAHSREWQWEEISARVELLEYILRLPPDQMAELAAADASYGDLEDLHAQGRYEEGVTAAEHQAEVRIRLLGPESYEAPIVLNNLAVLAKEAGHLEKARAHALRALALDRALWRHPQPHTFNVLNTLACIERDAGEYDLAETHFREALRMIRDIRDPDHPSILSGMNNLGVILYQRSHYADAEPLFREALAWRRRVHGDQAGEVAQSLNNLAVLLKKQGKLTQAEQLYLEAISILRATLPEANPMLAQYVSNLGNVLYDRKEYGSAQPFLEEALSIRRRTMGEDHPSVAESLVGLAHLHGALDQNEEAEAKLRAALAIRRRAYGAQHPDIAEGLIDLAILLRRTAGYSAAEPLLEEALAMLGDLVSPDHPLVVAGRSRLAECALAGAAYAEAESLLASAADAYETARVRMGAGSSRSSFLASPHLMLAAAHLLAGHPVQAWPAVERSLGRGLADLLLAASEHPLSVSEEKRADSLRVGLGQAERRLTALQQQSRADSSREMLTRVSEQRTRLLEIQAAWSKHQQEVVAQHPVPAGDCYALDRVQAQLSSDCAILGWVHIEDDHLDLPAWGYVIRSDGPVRWVALEEVTPAAHRSVDAFRESLRRAGSWPLPVMETTRIAAEGNKLWRQWVAPLMPHLEEITHLIVLSDGPLLGVPLEILVDADGVAAIESTAISYAPSATIYSWLRERRLGERPQEDRALLLGDPPFCPDHVEPILAALPRLAATRQEVERIACLLPSPTVLVGEEATEQSLTTMVDNGTLTSFRTIHLATHAIQDALRPDRSALVFSTVDLPDPFEAILAGQRICDGLITTADVVREWDIRADLVTLSCCQTGLGSEVPGEGYIGWSHAFLQAGARNLLVSLWDVEDEATALLMERFYQNLGTLPATPALREAKQWLRTHTDGDGTQPFSHPAYWSPFVLIGAD